jgi:hypothetical protein
VLKIDPKMYLNEEIWENVNWINLAQNRDHLRVLLDNGNEPQNSIKFWEFD